MFIREQVSGWLTSSAIARNDLALPENYSPSGTKTDNRTNETALMNMNRQLMIRSTFASLAVAGVLVAVCGPAKAERIENEVAVFAALDKVTARISKLEVPLNQTVEFGSLKVTPRACYSRPATEQPKTTTFVEVDEKELEGAQKRIFTGWMFAESPGLNAVEHPVFDIWLTGCSRPIVGSQAAAGNGKPEGQVDSEPETPQYTTRRRVRR